MTSSNTVALSHDVLCANVRVLLEVAKQPTASMSDLTCTSKHELLSTQSSEGRFRRWDRMRQPVRYQRLIHTLRATATVFERYIEGCVEPALSNSGVIPEESESVALHRLHRLSKQKAILLKESPKGSWKRLERILSSAGCEEGVIEAFERQLCCLELTFRKSRFDRVLNTWDDTRKLAACLEMKLDDFLMVFHHCDATPQPIAEALSAVAYKLFSQGISNNKQLLELVAPMGHLNLLQKKNFYLLGRLLDVMGAEQIMRGLNMSESGLKMLGSVELADLRQMRHQVPAVLTILRGADADLLEPLLAALERWITIGRADVLERALVMDDFLGSLREYAGEYPVAGKALMMLAQVRDVIPDRPSERRYQGLAYVLSHCADRDPAKLEDLRLPASYEYTGSALRAWAEEACQNRWNEVYCPEVHDDRLLNRFASCCLIDEDFPTGEILPMLLRRELALLPPPDFVEIYLGPPSIGRREVASLPGQLERYRFETSWAYDDEVLSKATKAYLALCLGYGDLLSCPSVVKKAF